MKKRTLFLLILVLIACFSSLYFARPKILPREQDREFSVGSPLRLSQVSECQTENLYKLCKVWGFVKYYHPSVNDGTLNWDAELLRVLPELLECDDEKEADQVLYSWLSGFPVPELEIDEETESWLELQKEAGWMEADTDWITDAGFLGPEVRGYLSKLSGLYQADRRYAYASFAEGAPYVAFENETSLSLKPEDAGVKLLALFRFWNIYQYYSPNLHITVKDWDLVLRESIPEILAADTYRDYVLSIARMTAQTADAHITLRDKDYVVWFYYGRNFLPCAIKEVDGQAVVSQSQGGVLLPGDRILAVDGISIEERSQVLSRYIPLPEPDRWLEKLKYQLLESEQENASVLVLRDGEEKELSVSTLEQPFQYKNPVQNGFLCQSSAVGLPVPEGKIGYIDPSALKEGDVEDLMESFQHTDGIIVDLRYYPTVFLPYLLGEYITPEPVPFAVLTFPNQAVPGAFYKNELFYTGAGWMKTSGMGEKEYPRYEGKVILLMDGGSVSQSEFTVMALRQAPNAVVLGSASMGADGNVVSIPLPGGIQFNMTGLGVYTPEGGQTQRTGLVPDEICFPTEQGLREGRDELIERAVQRILQP